MNGLLDRIVQRRRASASSRLGPPNGASPPDREPADPHPADPHPAEPHPAEPQPAEPQPAEPQPGEPQPPPEAQPAPEPKRATAEEPRGLLERSRIRRRTRFLRRLRELQLRDIGGFMLELHRFGRDRPDLVGAKLEAAARTNRELRALERALGERGPFTDVREPGIGGACSACGTVHGSADRYCSWCGREL